KGDPSIMGGSPKGKGPPPREDSIKPPMSYVAPPPGRLPIPPPPPVSPPAHALGGLPGAPPAMAPAGTAQQSGAGDAMGAHPGSWQAPLTPGRARPGLGGGVAATTRLSAFGPGGGSDAARPAGTPGGDRHTPAFEPPP